MNNEFNYNVKNKFFQTYTTNLTTLFFLSRSTQNERQLSYKTVYIYKISEKRVSSYLSLCVKYSCPKKLSVYFTGRFTYDLNIFTKILFLSYLLL